MRDEYDFATAERGEFFREGARFVPPVHLDPEVLDYLTQRAAARGISLSSLVNTLLKKDIELIDAAKYQHRCPTSASSLPTCDKLTRRAKFRLTRRANQWLKLAHPGPQEGRVMIV